MDVEAEPASRHTHSDQFFSKFSFFILFFSYSLCRHPLCCRGQSYPSHHVQIRDPRSLSSLSTPYSVPVCLAFPLHDPPEWPRNGAFLSGSVPGLDRGAPLSACDPWRESSGHPTFEAPREKWPPPDPAIRTKCTPPCLRANPMRRRDGGGMDSLLAAAWRGALGAPRRLRTTPLILWRPSHQL